MSSAVSNSAGISFAEDDGITLPMPRPATPVALLVDGDAAASSRRYASWSAFARDNDFNPADRTHISVRAHFENGGGVCHIAGESMLAETVARYPEISLLVTSGKSIWPRLQEICVEGSGIFAIADGPSDPVTSANWPGELKANPRVAAYYPWLSAPWTMEAVPPSAVMSGIYCAVERNRGIWKSPANVALRSEYAPLATVTTELQAQFNQGIALNMFCHLPGIGLAPWGTRTMEDSDAWRYIGVRRLADKVERDVQAMMRFAVGEPNTAATWTRARLAIESYLHGIWQRGGLKGARPEEGYQIEVGMKTTSSTEQDSGSEVMVASIRIAPVKPAEFIVVHIGQKLN